MGNDIHEFACLLDLSAELEPLYKTTFHFFFHRIIYGLISALSNYIPFFPNFSKQEKT